jgi:phosphate:Na+ symporter
MLDCRPAAFRWQNLIFRALGAGLALMLLPVLPLEMLGTGAGVQLVNLHVLFNLFMLVVALPFVGLMDQLTARIWPTPEAPDTAKPYRSALDRGSVARPSLALASAQRELLRMGETLEAMFGPAMEVLDSGDTGQIARLRAMDDEVNRRHTDIKLFVAEVNRGRLTEEEMRRGLELAGLAIDFEAIGDLIAKGLLAQATDKASQRLTFSDEGWAELNSLHARVLANMRIAMNLLVSGDLESAQHLAGEKTVLRRIERECHDHHLARLRKANPDSIDSSDIHLEVVRALKEINSLLVKVAWPILTERGHLLDSRLAQTID